MVAARGFIRSIIGLVGLVTGLCCFPTSGYACSPASPSPWFTERITVPSAKLPSGVGVRVLTLTNYGITRDYVEITNSASTPLYIIGTPWTGKTTFASLALALPAGVGPTHKVLNGHAFTWRPIFDTPHSYARMDWESGTSERPDTVVLSIGHNILMSDEGNVLELAPRNHTGDARPTNAPLPVAQTMQIPLVYGTQMLHVSITVSYILNPVYDAASVAKSQTACRTNILFWPLLCVGVLLGSAGIGFAWLGYRRWMKARARRLLR